MGGAQDVILDGSMLVALPVALAAGVLSFFTPCSLPLVPGYLSYVAGMAGAESEVARELGGGPAARKSRTVAGAALFVLDELQVALVVVETDVQGRPRI